MIFFGDNHKNIFHIITYFCARVYKDHFWLNSFKKIPPFTIISYYVDVVMVVMYCYVTFFFRFMHCMIDEYDVYILKNFLCRFSFFLCLTFWQLTGSLESTYGRLMDSLNVYLYSHLPLDVRRESIFFSTVIFMHT